MSKWGPLTLSKTDLQNHSHNPLDENVADRPILSGNPEPNHACPEGHSRQPAQLPSRYSSYIPLDTIIDQLLILDDNELSILLAHGPSSAKQIVCHIMEAELKLDGIANLTDNQEKDLPTVKHTQHSKYWNEWLSAMHEELEALKAKDVYEEIDKLPPRKKAIQSK